MIVSFPYCFFLLFFPLPPFFSPYFFSHALNLTKMSLNWFCTLDYSRNTTTGKHTNPTDHKHGSPLISPAIVDPPGLIAKQTFLSLNQNKEHVIQPVKEQDQKSGNQSKIGSVYQPETESASQSRVSSANRSVNQGGRYTLNCFFCFRHFLHFSSSFLHCRALACTVH